MTKSYTEEAQRLADEYARQFHGPSFSLGDNDANYSLKETAELIAQSRIEKQQTLERIAAQEQSQQNLAQAREDVSLLPDREAEKIQHEWIKDAEASARSYAEARNRNSQPRSTVGTDPAITDSVLSWVKKQKAKRALYKKN